MEAEGDLPWKKDPSEEAVEVAFSLLVDTAQI